MHAGVSERVESQPSYLTTHQLIRPVLSLHYLLLHKKATMNTYFIIANRFFAIDIFYMNMLESCLFLMQDVEYYCLTAILDEPAAKHVINFSIEEKTYLDIQSMKMMYGPLYFPNAEIYYNYSSKLHQT